MKVKKKEIRENNKKKRNGKKKSLRTKIVIENTVFFVTGPSGWRRKENCFCLRKNFWA